MKQNKATNIEVLKNKLQDIVGAELDTDKVNAIVVEVMDYQSHNLYENTTNTSSLESNMLSLLALLFMNNQPWHSNNPCPTCPMMHTAAQALGKQMDVQPVFPFNFPTQPSFDMRGAINETLEKMRKDVEGLTKTAEDEERK